VHEKQFVAFISQETQPSPQGSQVNVA